MIENRGIQETAPTFHDDENRKTDNRHAYLAAIGIGVTSIGSLVWSAGILAESSSSIDQLTVPGAATTLVGLGMMAVGSTLHHREISKE